MHFAGTCTPMPPGLAQLLADKVADRGYRVDLLTLVGQPGHARVPADVRVLLASAPGEWPDPPRLGEIGPDGDVVTAGVCSLVLGPSAGTAQHCCELVMAWLDQSGTI